MIECKIRVYGGREIFIRATNFVTRLPSLVYDKEKEKNRRVLDQHLNEISSRDINNVIKLLLVQTVGI